MAVPSVGQKFRKINCLEINVILDAMGFYAPFRKKIPCQIFLQFVKTWLSNKFGIKLRELPVEGP
jgi:hypothetical protein